MLADTQALADESGISYRGTPNAPLRRADPIRLRARPELDPLTRQPATSGGAPRDSSVTPPLLPQAIASNHPFTLTVPAAYGRRGGTLGGQRPTGRHTRQMAPHDDDDGIRHRSDGLIGTALVRVLVARGHRVYGLTRSVEAAERVRRAGAVPVMGISSSRASGRTLPRPTGSSIFHRLSRADSTSRTGRPGPCRRRGCRWTCTSSMRCPEPRRPVSCSRLRRRPRRPAPVSHHRGRSAASFRLGPARWRRTRPPRWIPGDRIADCHGVAGLGLWQLRLDGSELGCSNRSKPAVRDRRLGARRALGIADSRHGLRAGPDASRRARRRGRPRLSRQRRSDPGHRLRVRVRPGRQPAAARAAAPAVAIRLAGGSVSADYFRADGLFSNIRLRALGFRFEYPTLEAGLQEVLRALHE